MKKIFFGFALFIAAIFLNAQNNTITGQKDNSKTQKSAQAVPVRTKIDPSKLLQPIKESIKTKFAGAKILSAFKHETDKLVTYSVHVKINNTKWSLIYDSNGKYIKKELIKQPNPSAGQ